MSHTPFDQIVTVGLNPTIDKVIEVPGLRVGEHVKGRTRSLMPAGKAFNVSRVLTTLGVPNRAMGFLGRESLDAFNAAARISGIETDWTPISAPTRENLTLVDPVAGTATHIRDVGPTITRDDLSRLAAQLASVSRPGTLIAFCGSLPPGVAPDDFVHLAQTCIQRGAAVAVDTSGEPLQRVAELPLWLVKPNREELADLLGHEVNGIDQIVQAGRELTRRFSIVLITLGQDGAYAFHTGGTPVPHQDAWHATVSLAADSIRSTVGCGDTFLAGFIAAHQQGHAPAAALAHATAVAAASAMSDLPASFSDQDRLMLLEQVQRTTVSES